MQIRVICQVRFMSRVTLMRLARRIRLVKLVNLANYMSAKGHMCTTSPSIQRLDAGVITTMSQTAMRMAVKAVVPI